MFNNKYYLEDKSLDDGYYNDGIDPKSIAVASAVIAGGLVGYRSGLFKKAIREGLSNYAYRKPGVSVAFTELKRWMNSTEGAPEQSIFRAKYRDLIKNTFNAKNKGRVINNIKRDTTQDLKDYGNSLMYRIDEIMGSNRDDYIPNTIHNTDLLSDSKSVKDAVKSYTNRNRDAKNTLKSKGYETLLKKRVQTEKQARDSVKRTGYRKVELDDLFDVEVDDKGKIKLIEKTRFTFSESDALSNKSATREIEDILNSYSMFDSGVYELNSGGQKKRLHEKYSESFRHITVDKGLLIDENNSIIDIREKNKNMQDLVRSFATDWNIPIVKFNPLRMFGVDKIGKSEYFMGSISEDMVAPFLTGVRGTGKDKTIKAVKEGGSELLKGVDENITIIDGVAYRVSDDKSGITKMNYKKKKKLTFIPKKLDSDINTLTPLENSLRKMAGLSTKEFVDYEPNDGFKYKKQQLFKFFDIGYQEANNYKQSIDSINDAADVDGYIEKILSKVRPKPYKDKNSLYNFSELFTPDFRTNNKGVFFVMNESTKMKDLIDSNFDKEVVKDFFSQSFGSFSKDFENINSKTSIPYFLLERMSQSLGSVGMALSQESTKDTVDTFKNLILKRFLPIYAAYQGYQAINTLGEDDVDGQNPSTFHQHLMKGIASLDVGFHKITESVGLPALANNLSKVTPGSDMLEELPIINSLNLHQTADERAEHHISGYTPVRKSRYWSLNETPFIGGKIERFKPSAYRRAMTDAKYSDSLYGSRKERLSSILNQNHYDKKHYYDRPYLMSSPAFENVPIIGPVLSSTVGRLVKPQKKMHSEYWTEDMKRPLTLEELKMKEANSTIVIYDEETEKNIRHSYISKEQSNQYLSKNNNKKFSKSFESEYPRNEYGREVAPNDNTSLQGINNSISLYKTPSGAMSLVNFTKDSSLASYNINKKGYTLGDIQGVNERASLNDNYIINQEYINNRKHLGADNPNSIANTIESQYINSANVAGIYGFGATGFITGDVGAGSAQIETSGYSRSFSREFWDKNLGGAGKDISEIFRRFVQTRRNDINYYNPVRNTMPDWMPGDDGFINFQRGDPFVKVTQGEERLPGEGFERLHGIDMDELLTMEVGSSTLGKTKDEIVKHILHQDEITDKGLIDIMDKGTTTHERVEAQMLKSGIAIDSERKIVDKENNLMGYYDLRINDAHSKTGEAIMDVKTISHKGFQEVVNNNAPQDAHKRQVNFYLHNTNKDNRGHVMYINRDTDETFIASFDYDKELYESSVATVKQARNEVISMLERREISRADLYDPIDKFRILADIAPYSNEYNEMDKQMSNMSLRDNVKEEYRAIKDRVSQIKEPLRLYEYRFKYANIDKEKVTIGKQLERDIFMVNGSDNPIKLAGIELKKDHPNYQKAIDYIQNNIQEGDKVTIGVNSDSRARVNKDQLKTLDAVVYKNGKNINKELIDLGYAEEKEDDYSATGVHARFNALERGFGRAWERMAHFDSIANNKLLQVRSAKEDYERKHVYNKDFKKWEKPFSDFLAPAMWKNMNRGTLYGMGAGAAIGYMFAGSKNKYGRLVGSITGASVVGLGKLYKTGYEIANKERWVPKEKRKERELNNYLDKIKFVKNRRLFEVYSKKALEEDGINVKDMIESNTDYGNYQKYTKRASENVKRKIRLGENPTRKELKAAKANLSISEKFENFEENVLNESNKGVGFLDRISNYKDANIEDIKQKANDNTNKVSNNRKTFNTSLNSMKAIEYYNESEKTMQGYDPGEPLTNILAALPKIERRYYNAFLEAPEEERESILEIVPEYMRRPLQAAYGMKVDEKDDLVDYFSEHYLPGSDWDGWQEGYNLNAMKVKMAQNDNLDLGAMDIWQDDKIEADSYGPTPIPNMKYQTKDTDVVRRKLRRMLGDAGYSDLDISFGFNQNKPTVNLDMYESRKDKYENKLKERLGVY